jgi:hypothetical protein
MSRGVEEAISGSGNPVSSSSSRFMGVTMTTTASSMPASDLISRRTRIRNAESW